MVKMVKMVIPDYAVNRLKSDQCRVILHLTEMIRDFALLRKMLIILGNEDAGTEPAKAMKGDAIFFFFKILGGKIYEAIIFFEKSDLKHKPNNIPYLCGDWKEVFRIIRDKFAFHYDTWTDIDSDIEKAMKDQKTFGAWTAKDDGANMTFMFSRVAQLKVILGELPSEEGDRIVAGNRTAEDQTGANGHTPIIEPLPSRVQILIL